VRDRTKMPCARIQLSVTSGNSHKRSEFSLTKLLSSWRKILLGRLPMLSIEITRECPLRCPGCYAYGDMHLGGETTLRQLSDYRGDDLVERVLALVRKHRPLQVSLVGGEPLLRYRELNRILPALSDMGVYSMVVTSAVVPIPQHWMQIPRLIVAVSIDGLPEHHDVRRKPATYERILRNIAGRRVNVHWTITRPMLSRAGYLEEYVAFWDARPEIERIWISTYTPQKGEQSLEMFTGDDRQKLFADLLRLKVSYRKLLLNQGTAAAFLHPPEAPQSCLFSKMSANYSADLETRVEPCVFGGTPDCSQCGCAISSGLHWLKSISVAGPLKMDHIIRGSMAVGSLMSRLGTEAPAPARWHSRVPHQPSNDLVQIGGD
jgi:sulfatase maturation enzyme AslB (radical SAM superfamily)